MPPRIFLLGILLAAGTNACAPLVAPVPQRPSLAARVDTDATTARARSATPPRRTSTHPGLFPPHAIAAPAPLPEPTPLVELELEEKDPPEPSAEVASELESAPAPSWNTESLESRIASAAAPNVTAALRLVERGRQLLDSGDRDGALDVLERAVAIDPTNPYGYYFLARLYMERRSHNQALGFANRAAILTDPSDSVWMGRALSLQGAIFEDVARYPEARTAYRQALEADPRNVAARVGLNRLGADTAGSPR